MQLEFPTQPQRSRQAAVYVCFALSGLAALIYQTAWTREFALVFGTSELAVATVLGAYMAGLALGARLIGRWLVRIEAPVRLYAGLELGIGMTAVLWVPACLWLAERGLVALFGHQSELPAGGAGITSLYYLCSAFLTLLLPTTLMGATLPLLARASVHREQEIGARIGALYACNTLGAVFGALLGAFWLLPRLGLQTTQWSAAAINLLVALLALLLVGDSKNAAAPSGAAAAPTAAATSIAHTRPGAQWVLPLMYVSGVIAFTHEVLWTRLLQRIVGGSVFAFGLMVASFLLGIALGGALGARLARNPALATRWWIVAQWASSVAAIATWYALGLWAPSAGSFWVRAATSGAMLLPLTTAIGTTYPLAVRILASDATDAPLASARVYSWNTVGAIVGALLAGFVLIPALRYEGTLALAAGVSAALALTAASLLARTPWRWTAPLGGVLLVGAVLFRPAVPDRLLHLSPVHQVSGPLLFYAVGRSADVVVVRDARALSLLSNGLPEADIGLFGSNSAATIESWMGALAVLARPNTRSVLIVGFGGGTVVASMPPAVQAIDVVELEPQVMRANRSIAGLRSRDPLADARLNVVINDARGALALSDKRYDAILSQPSHPWTAGASHLYTREFLLQAQRHLRPGGVFVQWMGAEFVDAPLLQSLIATLRSVFPEVRLYRPSATTLLFIASDQPIEPEQDLPRLRATLDSAALHYAHLGLAAPENLLAALALDSTGAAQLGGGTPLITDDDNKLATAGIWEQQRGLNAASLSRLLAPYDPLTRSDSFIHRQLAGDLSFDFIRHAAMRFVHQDPETLERMSRLAVALGDTDQAAYLRYQLAMYLRQPDTATQQLQAALLRWPGSELLRYAAVEPFMDEFLHGNPSPAAQQALANLPPSPALVGSGRPRRRRPGLAEGGANGSKPGQRTVDLALGLAGSTTAG